MQIEPKDNPVVVPQYTPNVFAKRITQELLDQRPELVEQQLKVGQLAFLREICKDDVTTFEQLEESHIGMWFINSRLAEEPVLSPDEAFVLNISVPRAGFPVMTITSLKDEVIKTREIIGILEIVKIDMLGQTNKSPLQKDQGALVAYKVDELDIIMLGENNPGYEIGTTLMLPQAQVDQLLVTKKQIASQQGKGAAFSTTKNEA